MGMGQWLNIMDYSHKYGISTSTIRRKLRAKKLSYKIEQGKYMIYDDESELMLNNNTHGETFMTTNSNQTGSTQASEEVIRFAERSISTITKLHENLLAEKDKRLSLQEQTIANLKEELSELRMLVKVLEDRQMGVTQL